MLVYIVASSKLPKGENTSNILGVFFEESEACSSMIYWRTVLDCEVYIYQKPVELKFERCQDK